MTDAAEAISRALKLRIGQLVSQYEEALAMIQYNHNLVLDQKDLEIKNLRDELEGLKNGTVQEKVSDTGSGTNS